MLQAPEHRWSIVNAEHRLLLDAIARRDEVDCERFLAGHIRRTRIQLAAASGDLRALTWRAPGSAVAESERFATCDGFALRLAKNGSIIGNELRSTLSRAGHCSSAGSASRPTPGYRSSTRPPARRSRRSRSPARRSARPPSPPPHDSLAGWAGDQPPRARAEILRRAFELMTAHGEQIARLITLENGKVLADARGEITYAAEFFRWFCEEAVRAHGRLPTRAGRRQAHPRDHQPVGVALSSRRGTSRPPWPPARSRPRWPPAAASCSSRPPRRR